MINLQERENYVIGEIVKMKKQFALTKSETRNRRKELVALGEATFILQNKIKQKTIN